MNSSFSVLVVDDSEDDRLFVRRAFDKNETFALIGELDDGESAIAYLAGEGAYGDRGKFPYPDILLLDLKLPRITGFDVLAWLREQKHEKLRVVILSGSFLPEDITRCKALGAHAYFKKEALAEDQQVMIADLRRLFQSEGDPAPIMA